MAKNSVIFPNETTNPHVPHLKDIRAEELVNRVPDVHIIDVRQPEEFTGELGHIPGAQLIVLDTLPEKLSTLPKDGTLVFVCLSGGRSTQAAAFAHAHGFKDVRNLAGGMKRWNQLGYSTEK